MTAPVPTYTQNYGGVWQNGAGGATPIVAADLDNYETFNAAVAAYLHQTASRRRLQGVAAWIYGNSYTLIPLSTTSTGNTPWEQLKTRLGLSAVTSYGISGKRIFDTAYELLSASTGYGQAAPVTGSLWPGPGTRQGVVFVDTEMNDTHHAADTAGSPVTLASAGGTRYLAGLKAAYEAALAIISSASRVEDSAATKTGTWGAGSASDAWSGGSGSYSTTPGSTITYTVTPPQTGPIAGKVWCVMHVLDPVNFVPVAPVTVQIDGGTGTTWTPPAWEQYTGVGGPFYAIPAVIPVTLPTDGAAHTIKLTHAGTGGQYVEADCVLVGSTSPNPIFVMQSPTPVAGSFWNSTQVAQWVANFALVDPIIQTVVAEFPNAHFVPTTMTASGISSTDGIHPNDLGSTQRTDDVEGAVLAWISTVARGAEPASLYAKI